MSKSANKQALLRLTKEYKDLEKKKKKSGVFVAKPSSNNILEWYYVIKNLEGLYEGGMYLGKIEFPSDYPFKPPSIKMLTPSGRFEENSRICISMSDFHPESWNPMWNVESIILGLISFMLEPATPTVGSILCTDDKIKSYTQNSYNWNLKNSVYNSLFSDLDPPIISKTITTTTTIISNNNNVDNTSIENNNNNNNNNIDNNNNNNNNNNNLNGSANGDDNNNNTNKVPTTSTVPI